MAGVHLRAPCLTRSFYCNSEIFISTSGTQHARNKNKGKAGGEMGEGRPKGGRRGWAEISRTDRGGPDPPWWPFWQGRHKTEHGLSCHTAHLLGACKIFQIKLCSGLFCYVLFQDNKDRQFGRALWGLGSLVFSTKNMTQPRLAFLWIRGSILFWAF